MKKISEMTPGEALTEQALAVFKRRLEQARKKAVESAAATKAVEVGETKGGLLALQLLPEDMPEPEAAKEARNGAP